mgnify:CR=1 FL=1
MKKILILGSNSFSGNHLVNFLLKKNLIVYGCSQSIENPERFNAIENLKKYKLKKKFYFKKLNINTHFGYLSKIIGDFKPDVIVDFLGQGMVSESWSYPELTFQSNVISKIKLYEYLKNKRFLKKYIKISTPEVFGSSTTLKSDSLNYNPSTPYALSHSSIETYLRLLNKQFKFPVIFSRFANFYGPYQKLYRVIPLAIHKAHKKEKFKLHGGGKSKRSFIYAEDFCQGIYKMIKKGSIGSFYQFSSNEYFSIRHIVELIYRKKGLDPKKYISNVKDRLGKDKDYKIIDKDTRKLLNWENKTKITDGINKVIEWYKIYNHTFKNKDQKFKIKK